MAGRGVAALRTAFRAGLTAAALGAALWFTPTPWLLRAPGEVRDVLEMVRIESRPVSPSRGGLYLTTVLVEPASGLFCLYAMLNPDAELVEPESEQLPPAPPPGAPVPTAMVQSQYLAKVAALRQLGYRIEARPEGADLVEVLDGSPASGVLRPGDVVIGAAGRPVRRAEDLRGALRGLPPHQPVRLTVRRGGRRRELLVRSAERQGHAWLGVVAQTRVSRAPLPFRIDFLDTEDIDGASAGLFFALAICDELTPGELVGDLKVAGTGTIDEDGRVGEIRGVDMKVKAAQAAGAAFFLCPEVNASEARSAAGTLQVVPVGTLAGALQALSRVRQGAPEAPAGGMRPAGEK